MGRRPWKGGHIHRQEDGRDLYVIERQIRGERYHISTRCHSFEAAMEQLERFEANPAAYDPRGEPDSSRLQITADLVSSFHEWLTSRPRPTTQKYANEMKALLAEWTEDLGGANLRALDLATLKRIVDDRKANRQHRIIAIKGFCAWLRQERYLLTRAQDVTMDLPVPQASPEQWKRRKAIPVDHVRAVISKLAPAYRDCLLVLGATGMHVTELGRFARHPDSEIEDDHTGRFLGVLIFRHKGGKPHPVGIQDADALEAAKRIRARGELPRKLNQAIRSATAAANAERPDTDQITGFGVGKGAGKMRHSVATWGLRQKGVSVEDVQKLLGHESDATTDRHYIDAAIPRSAVPLPKLTEG